MVVVFTAYTMMTQKIEKGKKNMKCKKEKKKKKVNFCGGTNNPIFLCSFPFSLDIAGCVVGRRLGDDGKCVDDGMIQIELFLGRT